MAPSRALVCFLPDHSSLTSSKPPVIHGGSKSFDSILMRLFKGPIALLGGILALRGAFAIDVDPENEGMSITRG